MAGLRLPSLEKGALRSLELWLPPLEPQRRSLFLHELLQEQLQFLEKSELLLQEQLQFLEWSVLLLQEQLWFPEWLVLLLEEQWKFPEE